MVTFGEAAGENLYFTANAIVVSADCWIPGVFPRGRPMTRNGIGVSDTQNVICEKLLPRAAGVSCVGAQNRGWSGEFVTVPW